jgi:hypothetical protein
MADSYRELVAILREHRCTLLRQGKGSHEIWFSPLNRHHVTVPRTTKSRHTANDVLKKAGIMRKL